MADAANVESKLEIAKQRKSEADAAFKDGQLQAALKSYHEALMYLLGLDKSALRALSGAHPPTPAADPVTGQTKEERTEVDEVVEKIYSNMSACHVKQGNWKRALETAEKAIAKNENNHKALFRKGKALGELGYFEKAEKVLEDLAKKNPNEATEINQELARLRAIDNEKERQNREKLRGFLSQKKTPIRKTPESTAPDEGAAAQPAGASTSTST